MADDSVRIRVSFMGSTESGPILGEPEPEDLDHHIDDLPYAELDTTPTASLAQVLNEAGASRGFPADFTPSYIALRQEERPYSRTDFLTTLVLVDDEDRATFGHFWEEVSIESAIRAHQAGALAGDPAHLVFIPYHGFGNGVAIDWRAVLAALGLLWQGLSQVSAAYGLFELSQRLSALFRRRAEVEEAHHLSWRERGAMPEDAHDFIKSRSTWTTPDLASLLGCPSAEAEAFIAGKGFSWDENDHVWRRQEGAHNEAGLIDTLDELVLFTDMLGTDGFQRQATETIEEYFRTGQVRSPFSVTERDGFLGP